MSVTVYIKPDKNTEVNQKEVYLSQIADVWCRDKSLEAKCKAIKVMSIASHCEEGDPGNQTGRIDPTGGSSCGGNESGRTGCDHRLPARETQNR